MQAIPSMVAMLALLNLSGGEIILILALLLVLLGARKLPELSRGLGRGISEFRDAAKRLADDMDDEAGEAGRSVGGIYGKPAAQALTSDNQVAELYDPAAFHGERPPRWRDKGLFRILAKMWRRVWRLMQRVWGHRQ